MKILIYTHKITPRIRYAFNLVFRDILSVQPEFTERVDEFIASDEVKISYSEKSLRDELFFNASALLFEQGVRPGVRIPEFEEDIFAWSFFIASRYEEYLPHRPDKYDRFDPRASCLYKKNLLSKPIINILANQVKEKLTRVFPQCKFPERTYRFIPTIDVDNAYAYNEKGIMRTAGAYSRSLLKGQFPEIYNRTRVILGKVPDPYDVFDFLISLQKKYHLHPVYFFLLADYGLNDKNVSHTSKKFQSLIKSINDYAEVGIHPSFNAYIDKDKLKTEMMRLSGILHKDITRSRQHFLKIRFPDTYRNLIQSGITDDYTMGYASEPGFRAGLCTPFYFYDLVNETETSLKIHPFCLMEATFKYYKNLMPGNAMEHMKPIIDEVKKVNGTLYTLWHNDFLSEEKEFSGWRKVFEEMIKYAATIPQLNEYGSGK